MTFLPRERTPDASSGNIAVPPRLFPCRARPLRKHCRLAGATQDPTRRETRGQRRACLTQSSCFIVIIRSGGDRFTCFDGVKTSARPPRSSGGSARGDLDVDLHVAAARHLEVARPAVRPGQNVAGRRNDVRPHASHACANAASKRSIASGQATCAPRPRDIDDRDLQRTHESTMAVRCHEHDRCA